MKKQIMELDFTEQDKQIEEMTKCIQSKSPRSFLECLGIAQNLYGNNYRKQSEWISVEEQAEPSEDGSYLCYGYWLGSKRYLTEVANYFGEWNISNNFVLTHWMPLPEPPK